ncbi:MAG: hypothetical protein WCL37_06605 [Chrysiogenales bacterium]
MNTRILYCRRLDAKKIDGQKVIMPAKNIYHISVATFLLFALLGCQKHETIEPDSPPTETGELIAYSFQPGTAGDIHKIYTINSDGSGNKQAIFATIGLNHHDWSPDGTKLALVGYMGSTNSTWSIHTVNADGSNLTRLTFIDDVHDNEPSWSPNGVQIAFSSDRSAAEHREVYVMKADGTDVRRVTNSPGNYTAICLTWRPLTQ